METTASRLTILYEDPFWIGLYERQCDGEHEVCKIIFENEPMDGEVYSFLLKNWNRLRFYPSADSEEFAGDESQGSVPAPRYGYSASAFLWASSFAVVPIAMWAGET